MSGYTRRLEATIGELVRENHRYRFALEGLCQSAAEVVIGDRRRAGFCFDLERLDTRRTVALTALQRRGRPYRTWTAPRRRERR